jgi:sugar phosphate isomerase/epimerase
MPVYITPESPPSAILSSMIEFACHTWTFPDLTLSEAIGTTARLGFRRIDIAYAQGAALTRAIRQPRAAAAEIRADLALYALEVSDLFLMLPRISTDDAERRAADIAAFTGALPFALELGVPGITVSPGVVHPPEQDAAAWERALAALTEMQAAARAAGVALSIAPHVDSMTATPERARQIVSAIDGMMLTLDWASLTYGGARHEEIAALLRHARHIQVRGAAKGQLQATLERSRIDPARLLEDAVIAGYDRAIAISLLGEAGRHRVAKVTPAHEAARLRDALREARDAVYARQRG